MKTKFIQFVRHKLNEKKKNEENQKRNIVNNSIQDTIHSQCALLSNNMCAELNESTSWPFVCQIVTCWKYALTAHQHFDARTRTHTLIAIEKKKKKNWCRRAYFFTALFRLSCCRMTDWKKSSNRIDFNLFAQAKRITDF